MKKEIETLRNEEPKYFNTHSRNIFGMITDRKLASVVIDLDYTQIIVNLDTVEIDFVPKSGDRVVVECNVQSDDDFIDDCGEILNAVSILPARREECDKCIVKKLYDDWGVVDYDCYFTFDILPGDCKPNINDLVSIEKIECSWVSRKINIIFITKFRIVVIYTLLTSKIFF